MLFPLKRYIKSLLKIIIANLISIIVTSALFPVSVIGVVASILLFAFFSNYTPVYIYTFIMIIIFAVLVLFPISLFTFIILRRSTIYLKAISIFVYLLIIGYLFWINNSEIYWPLIIYMVVDLAIVPGLAINLIITRNYSRYIKVISITFHLIIIGIFSFSLLKPYILPSYTMTQANWQKINSFSDSNPNNDWCVQSQIQWDGQLYEGSNCHFFIGANGKQNRQQIPLQLKKDNLIIWSSDHYVRDFKLFNCKKFICIIGNTSDRPKPPEIVAETSDNRDLTVILWPTKKQLIYSNPCKSSAIQVLDIEQISTKIFRVKVGCDFGSDIYQTEINLAGE